MVSVNKTICPRCGDRLKYYDKVKRIVRTKGGYKQSIRMRRLRCPKCGGVHREFPNDIFPYKQYDAEIIRGVLEGFITPVTIGYEDYPCEITMIRWKTQLLL